MRAAHRLIACGSALSIMLLGLPVLAASPATAATILHCGDTITVNTTLGNDVGPCAGTAIQIGADNVTLNLNGHTVSGMTLRNGDTPGIEGSGVNGATVENGTVTGFDTGVYFEFGSHETITHVFAHDNLGPLDGNNIFGEGIQLYTVTDSTITDNQVVHNGPFAGIDIFDVSGTTISNNVVINSNVLEPATRHCGSPDGCMQDIGIWVVFLSIPTVNNTVSRNTVANSGLDGIQLSRSSDSNEVDHNVVTNNGWGQVVGPRDGDGIVVFGNDSVVQSNTVTKNAAKGIRIFSGRNDQILDNVATANGGGRNSVGKSFDLADTTLTPPCDHNTWSHNVFVTFNQACVTH